MEVVSNNFRPTIYSGEANHIAVLTIGNTTIDNENIKSIKVSNPIIDKTNDTFYIGTFISKQVEIEFYNADKLDLTGQLHLSIGTYIKGEDEYELTEDTEFEDFKMYYEYENNEYIEYTGDRDGDPSALGLYELVEGQGDYEILNIGYFNIETSPEDYYQNAKIVALDNAVKFKPNVDYSSAMTPSLSNPEVNTITCENLLIWLCDYFDVTLGTYPNVNKNIEISTYDSSISGKQYISYIAEIMGGNAQIGRDGHLYIVPLKQTPCVQIDATQGKSWELGDKYEISGVSYFDAIREVTFSLGSDTENTLFIRSDNPFVVGDNDEASAIIENVYDEIVGTTIYNLKCENYADYSLDSWDCIEYTLEDFELTEDTTFVLNKTYYELEYGEYIEYTGERTGNPASLELYEIVTNTYQTLNNNEYTYEMTIMGKVEIDIPNKQVEKTTNTIEGNEKTKFNILKTVIDNQNNEIRIIAGQSEDIQSQVNTLTASQKGLANSLVTAGGTNLIKNSALFFSVDGAAYQITEDTTFEQDKTYYEYTNFEYVEYTGSTTGNPHTIGLYEENGTQTRYENWQGELDRDRADSRQVVSESGTVILTKTLGAKQSVNVTPDSYTLSCQFKKLSPLSTLTFQIEGEPIVEYQYSATEDTQFIVDKDYYSYIDEEYTLYTMNCVSSVALY